MKEKKTNKNTFPGFFTDEELRTRHKEWEGMPEFIQGEQGSHKTIKVHFSCQDDVDKFSELIGQKITKDTKWIWFPKLKRANLIKKACVNDES